MNKKKVCITSLILLDLSAAFDTVDHSILHRFQHWFGLHGTSLEYFSSHLTFSGSLHPKFHLIFLKSFLWCTSRFRPLSSQRTQSNTTSMLMTPSCTFLSDFHSFKFNFFTWNTLQYFLWHTLLDELVTNCSSIHPKLNSYSLVQNNNGSNFFNSLLYLWAMISS